LARNVINTEQIDQFLTGMHVEDIQEINGWLDTTLRKFLINRYDKVIPYKPLPSDPAFMQGKTDLEKVVLSEELTNKVQHIVDYLKNKLTAEPTFKLGAFQAEEAFKQSEEWSKQLAKKKTTEEEEGVDYKIVMPLGEGYNWVDLISQNSLLKEGKSMGHCVGGYWDRVKAGVDQIFSLRDDKNAPHATIEYSPRSRTIRQIKGKQNRGLVAEYMPYLLEFLKNPPVPVRKVEEYELALNGLLKAKDGYLSLQNLPEGAHIDQNMDLSKFKDITLPKNMTVSGDLKVTSSNFLPEGLTVTGTLNLTKSDLRELPARLTVGTLNIFGLGRMETLPDDIKISKELNAEFSGLEKLPDNFTLKGDCTVSDTALKVLPKKLKVGGELDIMNTQIETLPKDLKVGKAIFVDDPDTMEDEAPEHLKDLVH